MKLFFTLFLSLLLSANLNAQSGSAKQVKWTFTATKIADNTYEVKLSANIAGKFHMYSQDAGVEGPLPTTIAFTPNPLVTINGKVKEAGKKISKYEEVWPGNVNYYEKTVDFVQVVKLKTKAKTSLNGKVEFIVCDDSVCLPPSEVPFKIALGG